MRNFLLTASLLVLIGCQTTQQDQRAALTPLPEKGPPPSYAEVLTRARGQATIATEAALRNNWNEVQDAARALEQTAGFMPRAWDVPQTQKDKLNLLSAELSKEAVILTSAAKSMDENGVDKCLTRINQAVRKMRLDQ